MRESSDTCLSFLGVRTLRPRESGVCCKQLPEAHKNHVTIGNLTLLG